MEKIGIVVVCGATASGKTRLAIDLAKRFGGEVISADSMQIYTGLTIASAKPSDEEKQGVPHHMMDFLPPTEPYSVADYVRDAARTIRDVHARGKLPILCGGTGLYISALIDNLQFDDTGADYAFREEMRALAAREGKGKLLEMLRAVDPEYAEGLHKNNQNRIIRALEVFHLSGKTMTRLRAESRSVPSPYDPCVMMIEYEQREALYARIDARVDEMVERGLIDEAREFFTHDDYVTASQAIGYKELKPYLDGAEPLSECIGRLKRETRRYAKRQLTWFRRDPRIYGILTENGTDYEKILKKAENLMKKSSIL
ncbi:MAG: tRNA (adenosine(37)-N6)-dimethylallyltransferase MiaA [Bacteroides sp.]|nr:tRNA (adenosine(37)-N6)-dimethylallyltransferase MiaA [Eubacterium sp.]MCM1417341.1 tRNA (adenosine(37)-N6)-dimethylallyltransferase MiaA [Roseburia sp.]MCM1461466.1 tRNA (adenosine(37)-N6)-dimethylallyltransferase MiaA [Bacteroides sp.]